MSLSCGSTISAPTSGDPDCASVTVTAKVVRPWPAAADERNTSAASARRLWETFVGRIFRLVLGVNSLRAADAADLVGVHSEPRPRRERLPRLGVRDPGNEHRRALGA